jgi:DNA-binding MarR family transcriptional regulator
MTSVNGRAAAPGAGRPLPFAVLMDGVWRAFRRELGERMDAELRRQAAATGTQLRPSQLRLLSLTPPAGLRLTDLAARAGMTKQALGEFVATLQGAGLVEVTPDERDRRVRLVRPTPAGRRLQGRIEAAIADTERHWRDQVGPARWATFREVLAELGAGAGAEGADGA